MCLFNDAVLCWDEATVVDKRNKIVEHLCHNIEGLRLTDLEKHMYRLYFV